MTTEPRERMIANDRAPLVRQSDRGTAPPPIINREVLAVAAAVCLGWLLLVVGVVCTVRRMGW